MKLLQERRTLLETARSLSREGLTPGTSGNVSMRVSGGLLITPSGVPYDALRAQDMVLMRSDGHTPARQKVPSSEWRLHRAVYEARAEVFAVVHAHPMFCTTLAILRRSIPAAHYMIAVTGSSEVPCAPYATFGTEALSRKAVTALVGRRACLLANHGLVAVGSDLPEALRVAREVEILAQQYWQALQVGKPVILSDAQMRAVHEKFRGYGQPREC